MQARIVQASNGARWLLEGWNLFRAAPLGWIAMVFAYWMLMTLVSVLPLIGVAAARAASRRAPVELALLFDGLRNHWRSQLLLGAVYLVGLGVVLAGSAAADDGALATWMLTGRRPADEVLHGEEFLLGLAFAAALYTPVLMAFWFAPPLAAWQGAPAVKALFFSFFACLMNWRAFLVYGALTALLALALPLVVLWAVMLASLNVAAVSLIFPLLIVLLPTLFASFYASYRDVFVNHEPGPRNPV